jgi:hypothetical protein
MISFSDLYLPCGVKVLVRVWVVAVVSWYSDDWVPNCNVAWSKDVRIAVIVWLSLPDVLSMNLIKRMKCHTGQRRLEQPNQFLTCFTVPHIIARRLSRALDKLCWLWGMFHSVQRGSRRSWSMGGSWIHKCWSPRASIYSKNGCPAKWLPCEFF